MAGVYVDPFALGFLAPPWHLGIFAQHGVLGANREMHSACTVKGGR